MCRRLNRQLHKGKDLTLWCDGMASNINRKQPLSSDSDADLVVKETGKKKSKKRKKDTTKEDEVQDVLEALKAKHGKSYTPMQFRIWAEMIVGGVHISQDEPPSTTMFNHSGSVNVKKRAAPDVVTQFVDRLAITLSPISVSSGSSPAKVIENRSKCYKQLSELKNLNDSGVLSDEEYISEKESIMQSLKSLK